MLSRRAFTLIELLVVIGIIVVLMSLVIAGIALAKRAALRAKATNSINTLAAAVEQYSGLNGCYPEKWRKPVGAGDATNADVEAVKSALTANGQTAMATQIDSAPMGTDAYDAIFSSNPGTAGAAALSATAVTTNDGWWIINAVLIRQLMSIDASLGQKNGGILLDPWGKPLRYRPSKWYPMSGTPGSAPRIDAEDAPNPASAQIWSPGPDKLDDASNPGEAGDDLSNWPHKN